MPDTNGNEGVENAGRPAYDVRFAAIETRLAAQEVDVAVIRANCATKEDIQLLRTEMHAGHERILTLLYEHKLQMQSAMAQQREDFLTALAKQREDFHTALAKQREDLHAALAKQREDFNAALAKTQVDLHKAILSHTLKLYGFASLVIGGVYFIARYVH
ncbi:hypothetical protein GTP45_12160 [Pseudoduganella sp. FT55W]|uniref:DUF1640 domain-containing protein n=1 Tax=Duganella rivi TaxID=2666083 RepID=A0A7X4KC38_9BURK|nr:hypothetical protein [Duganella rivi]MYM67582.1 hypothetical protein [Duganella rivi]